MDTQTMIVRTLDWTFSITLMISLQYAARRKERFHWSLQYNVINIVASIALVVVAVCVGTYGQALRQSYFAIWSGRNLWRRYISRVATEV